MQARGLLVRDIFQPESTSLVTWACERSQTEISMTLERVAPETCRSEAATDLLVFAAGMLEA